MIHPLPQPWPQTAHRPLLGANGTEAMAVLLEKGADHLVDYQKVGPFMGEEAVMALSARFPLLLHLDDTLSVHRPPTQPLLERLQAWVRLTGTPWTSEHIAYGVAGADLESATRPWPFSASLSRETALANIVRNARTLAAALPVSLLLENIPLYPNVAHLHVCEPEFITEVLNLTDCGLLLDLAHARVTASVLGMDVHAYLEALPLERVVELHLSGPRPVGSLSPERRQRFWLNACTVIDRLTFSDGCLVDAHEPMQEADYALLAWTLARCQPQAISLEYYRDPSALREQLERLGAMIG